MTADPILGVLSVVFLFATPLWGDFFNDEWAHMPWRAWGITFAEQYARMPTFVICEYTMHVMAVAALVHARFNGAMDLWFAAWICGTANDVFFMFLPFCDNFWQAQATIMLTPRLPLYIVSMYIVMMYYSSTGARRFGFACPIAEAMMAALLMALLYSVYDINGARFVWWTWHDSDAAIYERLGGAPVGSTMWILTYSCLFNMLLRWCGQAGSASRFLGTGKAAAVMDNCQKKMRNGPTAQVILFVCTACTPLFMILLGLCSVSSLDIVGKPGTRTLVFTCFLFIGVVLKRGLFGEKNWQTRHTHGDTFVGALLCFYFGLHFWMMVAFDPTTHVSTGVHQKWSGVCRNRTTDIMGFQRQDILCGDMGPMNASRGDFVWGRACGIQWADSVIPSGNHVIEWYTVCGVASEPELARCSVLTIFGVVLYGRAFLLDPAPAEKKNKKLL